MKQASTFPAIEPEQIPLWARVSVQSAPIGFRVMYHCRLCESKFGADTLGGFEQHLSREHGEPMRFGYSARSEDRAAGAAL